VNLRLVLPEVWLKPTLNPEMIQLQLDDRNVPWEIAPDIGCADEKPRHATALGMCPHYHRNLLSTSEEVGRENQARGSHAQREETAVQVPDVRLAKLKMRSGEDGLKNSAIVKFKSLTLARLTSHSLTKRGSRSPNASHYHCGGIDLSVQYCSLFHKAEAGKRKNGVVAGIPSLQAAVRVVESRVGECSFWCSLGKAWLFRSALWERGSGCGCLLLQDTELGKGLGSGLERCRGWDSSCKATSLILKELFPAGTIARGIGVRSGRVWKFFDSNHAQSRGS
jgi:hypothetical protein